MIKVAFNSNDERNKLESIGITISGNFYGNLIPIDNAFAFSQTLNQFVILTTSLKTIQEYQLPIHKLLFFNADEGKMVGSMNLECHNLNKNQFYGTEFMYFAEPEKGKSYLMYDFHTANIIDQGFMQKCNNYGMIDISKSY